MLKLGLGPLGIGLEMGGYVRVGVGVSLGLGLRFGLRLDWIGAGVEVGVRAVVMVVVGDKDM